MKLSEKSLQACKMGAFEVDDLSSFEDVLVPLIAQHGEDAVIERCQIARSTSGNGAYAIDSVLSFFRGDHGLVAQRASSSRALMANRSMLRLMGVEPADIVSAEQCLRSHFELDDEAVSEVLTSIAFQRRSGVLKAAPQTTQAVAS